MTDTQLDTLERWLRDDRVYIPPQIRRIALLLVAALRRAWTAGAL